MAITKIRGNTQIQGSTLNNDQIAPDAAIETSKLAEGAELLKRDGSVALTGNLDAGNNKIENVAAPTDSNDVAIKSYVDAADATLQDNLDSEESARVAADSALDVRVTAAEGDINSLEGRMDSAEENISNLEADLDAEVLARQNADADLQSQIDALESGSGADISALEARVTTAESDINTLESNLAQEVLDRQSGDAATLASAQSYADQKVADLVNSAPAVLDTLQELAAAIDNDANFAATVVSNIANVQSAVDAEEAARIAADADLQAQLNAATSGVVVSREVPVGAVNGVNKVFTLAHTPNLGTEQVYLNGLLQNAGVDNDYVLSNNTITFGEAPETNAVILVNYVHSGNVVVGVAPIPAGEAEVSKLLEPVAVGAATIPAGGTHTYTINLGETYKEVLLTRFEWVQPSVRNDVPAARIGFDSFPTNSAKYNFCLRVKQGAGNSQRLFDTLTQEKIGPNALPVQGSFGKKVSEVGTAMGYGITTLSSPFDHIATYGKKIEISDVYLDGQNLIVKVKNNELTDIELSPYLGLSAVTHDTLPHMGIMINRVNVFGTDSIALLGGSFYDGRIRISHDKGVNFFGLTNDNVSGYFLGSIAKGTQNNFFVALLGEGYSNITVVEGSDLLATASTNFSTGLIGHNSGIGSFPTTEEYRHHDKEGRSNTWPNTGRSMDATDKNNIVFASFMSGFGRLDKVTNLSTIETILKIEDEYPDLVTESNLAEYHDYSTYVKVVDADTYFTSFCQYNTTSRNCFVKTTDGGVTWQKMLEDHPEFVRALSRAVAVSEDGLQIAVVAFTPSYSTILPSNQVGKALFNYSLDGGQTFQFASGSWGQIASVSDYTMDQNLFNGNPAETTRTIGELALFQNDNSFLLVVRDPNNKPRIFRSQGGIVWSSGTILSTFELESYTAPQKSGLGFDANEHFIAFGAYGYLGTDVMTKRLWAGSEVTEFAKYDAWGLKD